MKIKFRAKFFIVITLIITLFSSISIIASYTKINKIVKQSTESNIQSVEKMALRYINDEYKGDWKVEGDKLLKGDAEINNNYRLVDKIKKDSKLEITIFKGYTRVVTTIIKNGKRAVGTKAVNEVIKTTLKQGKTYKGEVEILNNMFDVEYTPIRDGNGKVIAMFFVGLQKQVMINQTNISS